MWQRNLCLIVFISWVFLISGTDQLLTSQTHVLMQLRKQLEYPSSLEIWENFNGDLCLASSSPQMSITCQGSSITELKIKGDKLAKVHNFNGAALPNFTLSQSFSIDSFVTTLSRLSSLRVLSLVSLGIWGPLPEKIHRLSSLEVLDLSSNFMFGSITPKLSTLVKLQALTIDGNYFNDTVPDWLNSLSNLKILSLKNNRFRGQFPSSVCRVTTLTDVALSHNDLTGKLPDMTALSNLHVLDLRENQFVFKLPALPKGLVTALLSSNSFSGEIPKQLGELDQLRHLDLSYNFLSGIPPPVLFSLPNITYLNLASNMLSGLLPRNLNCVDDLGFVDISGNKFVGRLPSCLGTTSGERVVKFDGNCLANTSQHQQPALHCEEAHIKAGRSQGRQLEALVGVVGGLVFLLILLAIGLLILHRKHHLLRRRDHRTLRKIVQNNSLNGLSSELVTNARLISQAAELGPKGGLLYRLFSLEELKEATNNFDQSNFMGRGSIGKLYKGRLQNGACVAVRSIIPSKKYTIQNLKLQLDLLGKLRHPHLVSLLGHCIDVGGQDFCGNSVFLIYEYVPSGSYRAQLSEDCPDTVLKWADRLAILTGVAKAVHFLHTGISPGCFNNRLKTNNILLDDHRVPKLSDYGLSIIAEETDKPEANGDGPESWQISKSGDDVYNFGFILLESLVGPIASGKGEAFLLSEMTSFGSQDGRRKLVDPVVLTTCAQESLSIIVSITHKCLSSEPSICPSFEDVLWNLQYAAQVQAAADADQKSDVSESEV